MADRNALAQEVKQLKAEQEQRTADWKETQAKLEAKAAYFQRGKITESIMTEVQKQLPSLVKGAMPKVPTVPSKTGSVLNFK
jgi:DNA-binding protein H-NS